MLLWNVDIIWINYGKMGIIMVLYENYMKLRSTKEKRKQLKNYELGV